ncbi:regulator of microtubule dynamics protein 2 isoform X3 [Meriones unguiculatus]|nr:regulator of microtubule dynamics protein 2 isoform X3 [Meriones unguiculatus]XP_060220077.1 regulator of microtubule dynamics protein 2 isoform X3 [Meriones unguiculatus]XP_060220082.1 regulator of microtubule dynamics protein 2 isoform X3 [Meriones unguiculatus]XP_060220083.1 regulator of microtubule dynamics protein 2 isoform X3 [Meriones unguiculatus]XP_060220088.1 regulator of microtubule dynamics protein 2 isoform X3 [Meriones unguiculatus]XP_060220094.1 regulator of microtubule dynam
MPHSTNKELILGIMVGTAGISLLALWYHKVRKLTTTMSFPKFLSLGKKLDSLTLQDESHSEQGTSAVFQRRQVQILEKLNELLTNMEELKEEIRFLKETIPKLEEYIQDELGGKVTVHKVSPQHRARKKRVTTVQSSATSNSSEEAESEGGYITANTDTEEQSFPVPKAFNTHIEELKLDALLQKVDRLRINESDKVESFELLCDHKEKFSEEIEFLWRLARAYGDMYDLSTNKQEKKHYANVGKTLGERAITRAPMNGHCHLWYAVLCGYVSEFEGLQNKVSCGQLFKEHLDTAIQLLPEEPFLYYLKGRYCYTVAKLSWIEKKMAATLFGEIPSSTVHEALQNFLKTEELQPGYSISNYMYAAKCCVELGEPQDAWRFCNLALLLPVVTKEDKDAHKEVKKIISSLKRSSHVFCSSCTVRQIMLFGKSIYSDVRI